MIMASLVAQVVKNLPAMWESWVRFLGWEDPWRRDEDFHCLSLSLVTSPHYQIYIGR